MKKQDKKGCPIRKTSIGGQALMEGIMMRGPVMSAMAVRNTNGEMVVEKFPTETKERHKFFKLPIVRGVFNYIDSMTMGTKCLMRSAEISGLEEAEEELQREKEAKKATKAAKKNKKTSAEAVQSASISESTAGESITADENSFISKDTVAEDSSTESTDNKSEKKEKKDSSALMNSVMIFSVLLGIVFSVALFIVLPSFLYEGATYIMPFLSPNDPVIKSLVKCVFEGILKILILIGYMAAISLMKDIRRTFQYHGAEHKTIFCYENGLELTVENVRKQRRFHPRCGTSFLILMVLVGIFVSFFVDPVYQLLFQSEAHIIVRVLIKIALLPIIVGFGYELIKIAGRYDNWLTRIISAPGVLLQHVTVLEPDDSMIECAIAAVKEVIPDDDSDKW